MLGELLDNGRHAARAQDGRDGAWVVSGFMAPRSRPDGTVKLEAHLGIVTIGSSFSETLERCSNEQTKTSINVFVNKHIDISNKLDREALITQAALMDRVSCDPSSSGTGGWGMSTLIKAMNVLGSNLKTGEEPHMVIISGSSCLQVRAPHNRMIEQHVDGQPLLFLPFHGQKSSCLSMKVRSPMPCSCSCLSPTRSQRRRRELHGTDSDMAQRLETAMAHTLRLGNLAELHG